MAEHVKSLFAKTDKSIFVRLRYAQLKLKINNEYNEKIVAIFAHNIKKKSSLFVVIHISFERYYFVLYDRDLTQKLSKMDLRFLRTNSSYIYQGSKLAVAWGQLAT